VVCIFRLGAFLEHRRQADRAVRALIDEQRKLAESADPLERFRVLWVAATLDEHLAQCTDHEVGELMRFVQERFGLFEPEFALCHHARRRLGSAKENFTR
jgi:hypothetical protein